MKHIVLALLSGTVLWAGPGIRQNTTQTDTPRQVTHRVFQPGEKMVFKVAYSWSAFWLDAGELVFKVEEKSLDGYPVLHLQVNGETYKSYEWFYKVKDRYESYIDPVSLLPRRFSRDVNEGGFVIMEDYDFHHKKGKVHTRDYRHNPVKQDSFSIIPTVHDVVSAIYYARTIDYSQYKPGDRIPVDVFIDGDTYRIHILYEGTKKIKTRSGKFEVYVLKPTLVDNSFFDKGDEMTIYATADKNKIPIRVESPLTVGWVKVDLIGYGGLSNPFDARIK